MNNNMEMRVLWELPDGLVSLDRLRFPPEDASMTGWFMVCQEGETITGDQPYVEHVVTPTEDNLVAYFCIDHYVAFVNETLHPPAWWGD